MKWRQEINEILARKHFGESPKANNRQAFWAVLLGVCALVVMIAADNDDRRRTPTVRARRAHPAV
jgi:hypothetical protein